MQIRRATVADAQHLAQLSATVQALHAQSRPEMFKSPVINDDLMNWFAVLLEKPDNHIFIAESEGEAVGYLLAMVIRRPENPFTYATDFLLIDQVSVNTEHQRQGCGKKLLESAYQLARAENLTRIVLGVWNFNIHAIEFYKDQGFRCFEERMERDLL